MILFNKDRCYNGGKQHKFVPRFKEVPRDFKYNGPPTNLEDFRKLFVLNEYLYDICEWCGKRIYDKKEL